MATEISFGEWLKRQRLAVGLTQKQLALQTACAAITIRKIEADERLPSTQIIGRLADIFAIPPAERLQFARFARGDWSQSYRPPNPTSPWKNAPSPRSNLPSPVTALIGRQKELDRVLGYLRDPQVRLITFTGPPGIGKTRLCLELASTASNDFPSGVYFVSLASLEDPGLMLSTLAQTFGYVETRSVPSRSQLIEGISDKRVLIVLDNCEHLVEAAAALALDLLSACPNLNILATSRESLRIPGEWIFSVPPLELPKPGQATDLTLAMKSPAVQLFVERAHAVQVDFELTAENLPPVVAICAQLDGLPLAIELIAARMRFLTPQSLLERLSTSLLLSADGLRAPSARQKTLGSAIRWSYNALPTEEQIAFAFLSVFSGGFSLEAASAVCPPAKNGRATTDLIASLLDKSLLQRGQGAGGEARFHMLAPIQQFALEVLRQSSQATEACTRHLAYFLAMAEEADRAMRGPQQGVLIQRIECELDNFHAALDWSISQVHTGFSLRLLRALGWPWEVRGHYREALDWYTKIRAMPGLSDYPLAHASLLNHLGRYCWTQGKLVEAGTLLEDAQHIALTMGASGELCLAETFNWKGLLSLDAQDDLIFAKELIERGNQLFSKWNDRFGIALSIFHLGIVERELGNQQLACSLLENSLAYFECDGDLFFIARVAVNLGFLHLREGNFSKAEAFFMQHQAIDQQLLFWNGIADSWFALAFLYKEMDLLEKASQFFENCVLVCREHGLSSYSPLFQLGLIDIDNRDFQQAAGRFAEVIRLLSAREDRQSMANPLAGMAASAAGQSQLERAAILAGAAQQCLVASGRSHLLPEVRKLWQFIDQSLSTLNAEQIQRLKTHGKAMEFDQMIRFALDSSSIR
jgi:predicted ATPase/transcriptional regulator with XRE-family HTH domain